MTKMLSDVKTYAPRKLVLREKFIEFCDSIQFDVDVKIWLFLLGNE